MIQRKERNQTKNIRKKHESKRNNAIKVGYIKNAINMQQRRKEKMQKRKKKRIRERMQERKKKEKEKRKK